MEIQPDVTPESSSAPVESAPVEAQPAEALNTETTQQEHEKTVPYERFQEVIKARQDLEQQIGSEDYKNYQKLDEAFRNNPQLAEKMYQVVKDMYGQPQQPQADPNDPVNYLNQTITAQQQQLQYLMGQQQAANYQRYEADFEKTISAKGVSEHWKPLYRQAIETLIGQSNPNSLWGYDSNLISQVFDKVHTQIQGLQRSERASYVTDKTKDNMPPSTSGSGATPRVVKNPTSTEERMSEVLELMRAAK